MIDETSGSDVWADAHLLQMALLQMLDVFSVQNEGSFIAPEERLRIFQRFYRSPGSQHKAPGTGIGLSVTKRIAEAHRGRVWVENDSETSTTFFFALPHICKEA
jgi:two-component system sensor histidine kinase KdpD